MEWMDVLGNYVFPIAMCLLMYKRMGDQDKEHKEEVDKLSEVVAKNTEAILALREHIGR